MVYRLMLRIYIQVRCRCDPAQFQTRFESGRFKLTESAG